ncbi:putative membrane protein [Candidatus Ichthyocystis hellenicum]|uniref:Putative membrane protein n=1 Tax=Candidatus Ichthyocystis hellenicum TaxID=1561003 RepID=A0A0S4M5Q4_9BURK|nr:hypothetical protein [Candidatus Ichthyocystis hellenicum]CUT18258.1 putative membrane protein [Candidatus Ichthyocystis hellenicum]
MKSCDSYFFRETTEDGDRSDSSDSGVLLNNHLLLNSVSQSYISGSDIVTVRRGILNRFLKRIILPANIIMSSAIFMSFVVGINAEDEQTEDWDLLLSRLCLLIFLQRTVGSFKGDRKFERQGNFPSINVKSELKSIVGRSKLIKSAMSHDNVRDAIKSLSDRVLTVMSDLKVRLISVGIDRQPVRQAQQLYSSANLDIESCSNLHEYLDNTAPETTSTTLASTVATTIPTTASTTVQVTASTVLKSTLDTILSSFYTNTPNSVSADTNNGTVVTYSIGNTTAVLPDTELTSSSSFITNILVIFMAALSLFTLIFFYARYKKHHVTNSVLKYVRYIRMGREERVVLSEELEEREVRILPPLLVVENEYECSPHSHSVGNACSAKPDSDFMKDLEVENLEENIYESID